MRALILAAVALFGLLGVSAVATADAPDLNRAFFFGDCEGYGGGGGGGGVTAAGFSDGCRGFGIFFGHFDPESLAYAVLNEYYDEFGYNEAYVMSLYGFKVGGGGTHFVPPIIGMEYGQCDIPSIETEEVETQNVVEGPDITGGLWIAWFDIEVCDDYYDD